MIRIEMASDLPPRIFVDDPDIELLAIVELEREVFRAVLQPTDHVLLQGRDKSSLKRETILAEHRERHGKPEIGVSQASFLAKPAERQGAFGIVEA